jgi:hypothetical protein
MITETDKDKRIKELEVENQKLTEALKESNRLFSDAGIGCNQRDEIIERLEDRIKELEKEGETKNFSRREMIEYAHFILKKLYPHLTPDAPNEQAEQLLNDFLNQKSK